MDAANESLADALRASFGILKGIMLVLVVLYLFSNVRRIDSHEQALTLRLGELELPIHDPGLVWALPFPIDEIVPLPTKQSNTFTVDSHSFMRRPGDEDKPLKFISWPSDKGLHPSLDGALITADTGLVHTRWKLTYKIDKVDRYVSNLLSKKTEAAEQLIRTFVETAGIHVAAEVTADEMIRTKVDRVQSEIRYRVNQRLADIQSGIKVTRLEMFEPTPPIPVRGAFDGTQRAENLKEKRIQDATQEKTKRLNAAAGPAHDRLLAVLDAIDRGGTPDRSLESWQDELDTLMMTEVEGKAGRIIEDAGSYLARVVGQMRSDLELYRTLVPEYERNPQLLVNRLYEEVKKEIFTNPGVTKVYRPAGAEFRIRIPLDPDDAREAEARRVQEKEFDAKSLLPPPRAVPVGPEFD